MLKKIIMIALFMVAGVSSTTPLEDNERNNLLSLIDSLGQQFERQMRACVNVMCEHDALCAGKTDEELMNNSIYKNSAEIVQDYYDKGCDIRSRLDTAHVMLAFHYLERMNINDRS